MSGPKVINIEAIRRRQKRESLALLQRLELALADCDRWQAAESQSSSVMDRLRQMQEAAQWELLIHEASKQCRFYCESISVPLLDQNIELSKSSIFSRESAHSRQETLLLTA